MSIFFYDMCHSTFTFHLYYLTLAPRGGGDGGRVNCNSSLRFDTCECGTTVYF